MFENFGVPESKQPFVQSMLADCSSKERKAILSRFITVCTWDEPVMPIILLQIIAMKKGVIVTDLLKNYQQETAAMQQNFIETIEARNEFIKTESQAVDQALKQANEEFSRKLAKLNDRVEASVETIAKTQSQLIQMHQQLAIRSRQNARGKMQTYGIGALIGLAIALFLQTL